MRRAARVLLRLLAITVVVAVAGLGVGAWYFADQLTAPPTTRPFDPDTAVTAVTRDTITLPARGFAVEDGAWGLQLPGGRHVVLTDQLAVADGTVTWGYTDAVGAAPAAGEEARVDEFVHVGTPAAVDLPFEEVTVDGPLGGLPSWWVPADGEPVGTVVFVHGRGGTREEALRFLPTMVGAGWNVLVQSYRGDAGGPALPDGRLRYGTTEWQDLGAAVDWVRARQDGPIVPFGVSMGGALVARYLDRGVTDDVAGVVLDSPLLSMDALLDLQADLNGVPSWAEPALLPVVQVVADLVHGLDSTALEQAEDDGTFDLPVLLFHGDADAFVPVGPSRRLAELAPDVTYVPVPEADHARSFNLAPDRYRRALVDFLDRVAASTP